jgi:hypothetical protein
MMCLKNQGSAHYLQQWDVIRMQQVTPQQKREILYLRGKTQKPTLPLPSLPATCRSCNAQETGRRRY